MSVKITIENHPNGNYRREILVSRIANGPNPAPDAYDNVHTYEAVLTGGGDSGRATFQHRYGDQLPTLMAEAAAALDDAGLMPALKGD